MNWSFFIVFLIPVVVSFCSSSSRKRSVCGCEEDDSPSTVLSEEKNANIMMNGYRNDASHLEPKFLSEEQKVEAEKGLIDMVLIPGGIYQLGTDDVVMESDNEGPKRMIELESFYLDKYEVSNLNFYRFVQETNYKTEAEKFGDSPVANVFLNITMRRQLSNSRFYRAPWWYVVNGTDWRHPHGPDSNLCGLADHPVTHVSWKDARVYCAWRGARLPTEAEWEGACRGGHYDTIYPWGNTLQVRNRHMANIWQGTFPTFNSEEDGYRGTNPVKRFPPNEFGLYNMIGNVWEWTEDNWTSGNDTEKVMKGGSHMCQHSYCFRYRCSARTKADTETTGSNLGFRCAKSVN